MKNTRVGGTQTFYGGAGLTDWVGEVRVKDT